LAKQLAPASCGLLGLIPKEVLPETTVACPKPAVSELLRHGSKVFDNDSDIFDHMLMSLKAVIIAAFRASK
jgi:hypothetical protein